MCGSRRHSVDGREHWHPHPCPHIPHLLLELREWEETGVETSSVLLPAVLVDVVSHNVTRVVTIQTQPRQDVHGVGVVRDLGLC